MTPKPTKALTDPSATTHDGGSNELARVAALVFGEVKPSFVIDLETASIIAANSAARDGFDVVGHASLPLPLDSAMPALVRLRDFAAECGPPDSRMTLVFWSNGRTLHVPCDVHCFDGGTNPRWIVVQPERATASDANADMPFADTAARPSPPPVGFPTDRPNARDDAETLKKIARQIREGLFVATPFETSSDQPMGAAAITSDRAALTSREAASHRLQDFPLKHENLARLAHELKTPLTAIASAAEIMRDERLGAMGNARYLGYAADVHESAQHALAVIAKMLGREGDRDYDDNRIGLVDLNNLVTRTVSTLQPIAADRRVMLAFEAEGTSPMIRASATALRQILINLVTNALKFTPQGGDVRVVTGYRVNGAPFLAVRDTGIGIDAKTSANVLTVSPDAAQVPPMPRPGGGFGIGLPLAVRLVRDMGGDIEIVATPGKGTQVLISFVR